MRLVRFPSAFLLGFLLFPFCGLVAQNSYTVSNLPGVRADFITLQGAIDSVSEGSILYVMPSATVYGSAEIRKRISIFGNGYLLGQNAAPNTQANVLSSKLTYLRFAKGSSGSLVSGIEFGAYNINSIAFDTTDNITIERCMFKPANCGTQGCKPCHFTFRETTSVLIRQSYIMGSDQISEGSSLYYSGNNAISGITFKNNVMVGMLGMGTFTGDYSGYSFDHNTIMTYGSNLAIQGATFTNNIIFKLPYFHAGDTTFNFVGLGPAAFSNTNIVNNPIFSSANNKVLPATTKADSIIITRINTENIQSDDGYYKHKPNSIAVGYSSDGTVCGAFGGTKSYILSGIPPIPNIYLLTVSEDATRQGGVKVSVKAKANN